VGSALDIKIFGIQRATHGEWQKLLKGGVMQEQDYKKKKAREEAQKWLKRLRSGIEHYEICLGFLLEEAQKGGLTLEDIGTSKEELEQLRIKGCKAEARRWLEYLRSGTGHYDTFLKYLREEVQRGGLTLEDVGTSEEELEQLRIKYFKANAQYWLEYLRSGTGHYDLSLKYLREEVQKGGLTLEDIGTSEKELEELRAAMAKK
jgi:hypothetical protein